MRSRISKFSQERTLWKDPNSKRTLLWGGNQIVPFPAGNHFPLASASLPAPDPKTRPSHIRTTPRPNHIRTTSEPHPKQWQKFKGKVVSSTLPWSSFPCLFEKTQGKHWKWQGFVVPSESPKIPGEEVQNTQAKQGILWKAKSKRARKRRSGLNSTFGGPPGAAPRQRGSLKEITWAPKSPWGWGLGRGWAGSRAQKNSTFESPAVQWMALTSSLNLGEEFAGSVMLGLAPKVLQNLWGFCVRVLQQAFYYATGSAPKIALPVEFLTEAFMDCMPCPLIQWKDVLFHWFLLRRIFRVRQ